MKACPQCQSVFPEDYVFCLNDGTSLFESDGEQQTLLRPKFIHGQTSTLSPEMLTTCPACALTNRANSKFCKKCGNMLSFPSPSGQAFPGLGQSLPSPGIHGIRVDFSDQRQSAQEQTIAFQPSGFAPPNTGGQRHTEIGVAKNRQIAIGGVLVGVLIIGGIVIFSSQNSSRTASESNDSKAAQNAANSNTDPLPISFEREYAGNIGGQSFSLSLRRSGRDLNGSAYTSKTDTLSGTIDTDGRFTLNGYENGEKLSGIYTGRLLGDGTVVGSWTTPNGTKQTPFNLAQR